MKIDIIDGVYIEENHKMKTLRLSQRDYPKAIQSLIVLCADAVIVDRQKKQIYLAKRAVPPMQGYWTIGGRRFTGEGPKSAISRTFLRETTVKAAKNRFNFLTTIEVIWKDRKEKPTDVGKHDLIQFFVIELTQKELIKAGKNLCPTEYVSESLTAFNKNQMKKEKIHPAMIKLYDLIFSTN